MATPPALKKRFLELEGLPSDLKGEEARRRGYAFESLVQDRFEAESLLRRRSYRTGEPLREQIDGALAIDGRRALLEVKWVRTGQAASSLYAFCGKVENKFDGTIGVFISRKELPESFLAGLRTGRRQVVLVLHGADVGAIFESDFDLLSYLRELIDAVSFENLSHLPAADYLARGRKPLGWADSQGAAKELVGRALENRDYRNLVDEWVEAQASETLSEIARHALAVYLEGHEKRNLSTQQFDNLAALIGAAVSSLPEDSGSADVLFFDELRRDFRRSAFRRFAKAFGPRLKRLAKEDRERVGKQLARQWRAIEGEFDAENEMAEVTEYLYAYLGGTAKKQLLKVFLDFASSNRQPKYPQMQLALKTLRKIPKDRLQPVIEEFLGEKLEAWHEKLESKPVPEELYWWYESQYSKLESYLEGDLRAAVKRALAKVKSDA